MTLNTNQTIGRKIQFSGPVAIYTTRPETDITDLSNHRLLPENEISITARIKKFIAPRAIPIQSDKCFMRPNFFTVSAWRRSDDIHTARIHNTQYTHTSINVYFVFILRFYIFFYILITKRHQNNNLIRYYIYQLCFFFLTASAVDLKKNRITKMPRFHFIIYRHRKLSLLKWSGNNRNFCYLLLYHPTAWG